MEPLLASYLSLRYESGEEQKYLEGLKAQYLSAIDSESYHMALFAYHLLFMSFVYPNSGLVNKPLTNIPSRLVLKYIKTNQPIRPITPLIRSWVIMGSS
ncbi:MAG: hypothetical protein WAN50_01255 [Minisyncoccia bacterium]